MAKNLPANAGREQGFNPWSGKIPWVVEQLSPWATTVEACPRACVPGEATVMWSPSTATKSSPCSLQLEKALEQQQKPSTAKDKLNKYYFLKKRNRHHPEHEQKANKPWTRCTPSPIREMQIKTTMRYHLTPSRMTAMDKTEINNC